MRSLFIVLFSILALLVNGQQKSTWELGAGASYGFLIPHNPGMNYLVEGHTSMFDLIISKRVSGEKDWHHYFNFPTFGLTMAGYDLASKYLGNAYATRLFIDLPLDKKRWIGLKMELGTGVVTKPFSIEDNIHNSALGSYLNASVVLKTYGRFPITKHIISRLGIGIHHFSNGAFKLPNSGLNLAMGEFSLTYNFSSEFPEREERHLDPHQKWKYYVGSSFGMKEIPPFGGEKYAVINAYGQALKRISPKSSLGGELGLNFNESLKERTDQLEEGTGTNADNFRFYIAATHQLHLDPFGLRFQLGAYLAPRFNLDSPTFLRYHLYRDFNKLQIFIGLKSHFEKADNIELGLNFVIR